MMYEKTRLEMGRIQIDRLEWSDLLRNAFNVNVGWWFYYPFGEEWELNWRHVQRITPAMALAMINAAGLYFHRDRENPESLEEDVNVFTNKKAVIVSVDYLAEKALAVYKHDGEYSLIQNTPRR